MHDDFLKDFLSTLPESQQQRLKDMMAVDPSVELNPENLEKAIEQILSNLSKSKPSMQLRLQEERADSASYNQTLREILADLHALYYQARQLDTVISNQNKLNISALSSVKNEINRIERKINALNLLADNYDGYSSASRDDFYDESKREKSRDEFEDLFRDKEGNPITLDAVIDKQAGVLELGTVDSNFDRIRVNGQPVATIEIVQQTGEGFKIQDGNYSVEKAIDTEDGTFWGEVVLSKEPLKVPLDGVTEGAICRLRITLPSPATVSEIIIDPYSEYPMELVSAAYVANDSGTISGYIKALDENNPPIVFSDVLKYSFPAVTAKQILLTIRQKHANEHTYWISKDQKNNKEFWSKVNDINRRIILETPWHKDDSLDMPSLTQDLIDEIDSTWQLYFDEERETLLNRIVDSILTLLTFGLYSKERNKPEKKEVKRDQVSVYEYVYGAYDINLYGKEYNREGIYVSKPHEMAGNIAEVVLEAEEVHPVFYSDFQPDKSGKPREILCKKKWSGNTLILSDDPIRRTSVEYYVSPGANPGKSDWFPILPLGQKRINQELIRFDSEKSVRAELRFHCLTAYPDSNPFTLYKDEIPLIYGQDWTFSKDNDGANSTKFITIAPRIWEAGAMFTIDYYPDIEKDDPYVVNFGEMGAEIHTEDEYFFGADKNFSVKLSKYPYVNRLRLVEDRDKNEYNYNPVRVTLNPEDFFQGATGDIDISHLSREDFHIYGEPNAITSEILSTRNPSMDIENPPRARLLNVTQYFDVNPPALKPYSTKDKIPTFEYIHEGKRVYFTEEFKNNGPVENFETNNGNAIIKVSYDYLISGVRVKIILRRTSNFDASVTPQVKSYSIKTKTIE